MQPNNPWIHSNLCQVLLENGELDKAERHGKKATKVNPGMAGAWNNLGNVYRAKQRLELALDAYSKSLSISSQQPDVLCNIGVVLESLGKGAEARARFLEALSVDRNFAKAYTLLGDLARKDGDYTAALGHLEHSLELDPIQTEPHCSLAHIAAKQGRLDDAREHYLAALKINDHDFDSIYGLGRLLQSSEQWDAAFDCMNRALEIQPGSLIATIGTSEVLMKMNRYSEAVRIATEGLKIGGSDVTAYLNLAEIHQRFGKFDAAREVFQKALDLDLDASEIYSAWSVVEEKTNQLENAREYAQRALKSDKENVLAILSLAKISRREKKYDDAKNYLDQLVIEENCASEFCTNILFETANLLDKQGRFAEAFRAYEIAASSRARKNNSSFDSVKNAAMTDRYLEFYSKEEMASWKRFDAEKQNTAAIPIFIVGFPRSGTTLLEQMLCSHPDIVAGGELPSIPEIRRLAAGQLGGDKEYPFCLDELKRQDQVLVEWRRYYLERAKEYGVDIASPTFFTDKMPLNSRNLPLIRSVFPDSPIIHIVRNPMDSCLSAMFSNFANGNEWANNIVDAANYFLQTTRLIQNFEDNLEIKYLRLRYEDLVADTEKWAKTVINFLGVNWDQSVLEFHKTKRVAITASYAQVNQKIYTTSVARYRNYEKYLAEPLNILEPVLKHYGYLDA